MSLAPSLPLIYVLSIGPVAFCFRKTGQDPGLANLAYAPVVWLHNETILRRPLEVYLNFWEGLAG